MTDMSRRNALRLLAGTFSGVCAPLCAVPPSAAATPLLRRPIPSSGEQLPVVGLGTWQTFDVGPSASERAPLEKVLAEFSALGGTLIDSSPMYGRSEEVVGELATVLGLRRKLFIATKVWTHGKSEGVRQMKDSMQKLQAKPIDLMQVHNLVDVANHLATLRDWKRQGIVRYIGVTHYTASAHGEVARVVRSEPLDFIQINYSVGERDAENALLPLAQERGVAVIINRPFAGGQILRRLRDKPLPGWADEIDCTSWPQLLLKYVIAHPAITCAIPATAKIEHLRDNMKAGQGRLPDEKLRARIVAEALA